MWIPSNFRSCAAASPESILAQQLIKVGDNFVEKPQTFYSFVIRFQFNVKLGKVWNGGEHDANTFALLVVQFL